jgi:hypothetical protein
MELEEGGSQSSSFRVAEGKEKEDVRTSIFREAGLCFVSVNFSTLESISFLPF